MGHAKKETREAVGTDERIASGQLSKGAAFGRPADFNGQWPGWIASLR